MKFWKPEKKLLFDLTDDVGEMIDISEQRAGLASEMEATMMDYLQSVNSDVL